MAHKARRRPSWKKMRSKHFLTSWERKFDRLEKQKAWDYRREIIAEYNKANNGA